MAVLAIPVWIYLTLTVRKKKNRIFHDQMEPALAEIQLKRLKTYLLVAGISFLIFIVAAIVHNVIYGLSDIEVTATLIIALLAVCVYIFATAYGLVIFLRGRDQSK
jgi:hypothetical protein